MSLDPRKARSTGGDNLLKASSQSSRAKDTGPKQLQFSNTITEKFEGRKKKGKVTPPSMARLGDEQRSPPQNTGGILRNRNQADDVGESQFSDTKSRSFYKYGSSKGGTATAINWKQKRDRQEVYQMQKAFMLPDARHIHIQEQISWADKDSKGKKKALYLKQVTTKNDIIMKVEEQTRLEKMMNYEDRWPLLNFRKSTQKARIYINLAASAIINHKAFETITIMIILLNSITLGMEDPLAVTTTRRDDIIEQIFLALYSIEMVLKILGLGFLFNKGAYLRDPWNVLDFIIVMSAYLTISQDLMTMYENDGVKPVKTAEDAGDEGLSLNSLRAFRVLRPLRAITSIKGLQVLVVAIMSSLPLLQDTILVLFSFFLVFAIAGTQLLSGLLKRRCVHLESGQTYFEEGEMYLCGGSQVCPEGYFCGKQNENPDFGVTNFDNMLFGLLVVFQCITLEGWSDVMIYYQQAYVSVAYILFLPMVFIGAFFLINLLLAVINSSFSSTNKEQQQKMEAEKQKKKSRKVVKIDEDNFNEEDLKDMIGIHTYGISKRVTQRLTARFARIQAIRAAEELERRNRPPEEEEEIRAHVVCLPDAYEPPVEETRKDVKEDSESGFSDQVEQFMYDLNKPDKKHGSDHKKVTKEIKAYAVNDMRTANEKQLRRDERKRKIQTGLVDKHQLAMKEIRSPENASKNTMSDFNQLEQFVGLDQISGRVSGENPFDLSQVHSQIADYPDFSDDEPNMARKAQSEKDFEDDQLSAIASDSSFASKLQPKEVEDSDGADDIDMKPWRREKKRKVFGNKRDELSKTVDTIAIQSAQNLNSNAQDDLISQVSKKKKKKGGKVDPKVAAALLDPHSKYSQIKQYMRNKETEFMQVDHSNKDPYQYINKKTHKIELAPGVPYRSTSMDEIYEIKNQLLQAKGIEEDNKFIKAKMPAYAFVDERVQEIQSGYSKPRCSAYQMKTVYQINEVEEIEFSDDDDDALVLALQPFDTAMSVGYGHLLTHRPVKFVARRSDIIVSSTLSITLTPADTEFHPLPLGTLEPSDLSLWCEKRCEFRGAHVKVASLHPEDLEDEEYIKGITESPEKKNMNASAPPLFGRALTHAMNLQAQETALQRAKTLGTTPTLSSGQTLLPTQPRKRLIPPTLLTKPLAPEKINQLNEEEKRLYQIQKGKFDTYLRILDKKKQQNEHPCDRIFKWSEVQTLLEGKHHEEEEEDFLDFEQVKQEYLTRGESFANAKLEQFEIEARKMLQQARKIPRPAHEYIPQDLKKELDLPGNLRENSVNFNEVIKRDCSVKRKTPVWSGQDVLETGLNMELASWCVAKINGVRVWPKGLLRLPKKIQVSLKMIVKHKAFDSSMTLAVLLNTIVMGMEAHNMDPELKEFTEKANEWFTWIFIVELTLKMLAIGPKKYVADKMNWLDGGVVTISIIEMVMTAIGGQGGNLSAFNTVRVFRTFRVLRVARLLRQLKSMRTILAVVISSADGFLYITLLMFVFVFIYTLLGMQVFGGNFNFEDGVPRGNYDTFQIAFFTVFQVLTTENWNSVLYDSMRNQDIGLVAPVIYYVSWIFVGNFILLNLFLAILLDGFLCEDGEENEDEEEIEINTRAQRRKLVEAEKARRLKKMGLERPTTGLFAEYEEARRLQKQQQEEYVDDIDDMDDQVMREIFMDEGLIKKKDPAREKRLRYNGIACLNSVYLFNKDGKFRLTCVKLYKHSLFDNFIMFLIGVSSLKLGFDSYLTGYAPDSKEIQISSTIDFTMNILFLIELMIKVVAMGLFMDEGSYLREGWNQLDAFIVATSILDMALTNVDLPVIKILRLLRTLRPLRVISHNVEMKLVVTSLFESVGAIFNVIIVVMSVWLMFAIFAINIFSGKFFYCSIGMYTYHTKFECNVAGGSWQRFNYNFDDISQAMLTLFGVASLEGWPDVLIAAIDTTEIDEGPAREASVVNGFFFIVFILIGSFFLMNFFVGVLFLKYNQAQKNENKGFTLEHLTWKAIQKMIVEQRCDHSIMNKPDGHVHPKRLYYWKIVTSMPFDVGILGVIVLNIMQMGIMFENQPPMYTKLLDYSNYVFTIIFTAEAYLKLRAFSYRYFETSWNKFDFFIVVTSLLDIVFSNLGSETNEVLSLAPQVARLLRVLRVTRVVRLAKKKQGLQALMSTITLSVGPLTNVFLLLMLALFIFSILAVFFFSEVKSGNFMGPYRNYEDFGQSFLTLFVIATGENWNGLMYDCLNTPPGCTPGEDCGTSLAPLFYIIFVVFIQNVMLNLFILVILTQFELYYMSDDNPIKKFQKSLNVFMATWIHFTQTRYRCLKLREKKLNDFFRQLPMPLGMPADTPEDQMKKVMLKMGIRCDDGYVYFNELLYRCMRRQYGNFKLNRKMQIVELKTQYTIYQITIKQQAISNRIDINEQYYNENPPTCLDRMLCRIKKPELYDQFFNKMVGVGKSVNPFLLQMYFHISFNTWLNYTRRNQKRERHYLKEEKRRNKAIKNQERFVPIEFQEEAEKLQEVSIEVDELILYTSEEDDGNGDSDDSLTPKNAFRITPHKTAPITDSKKGLNARKTVNVKARSESSHNFGSQSQHSNSRKRLQKGTTVTSQVVPEGQPQTNSNKKAASGTL